MLYKSSSRRILALLLLPIIVLAKDGIADQNPGDTSSSRYWQENINQIYDKNIDNFEKILSFSSLSKDLNFKADVILGLYSAMTDVRHFENPMHAISMYNELEALINANISDSNLEQREVLEAKRNQLAVLIIEKGADVLESAVFMRNCKDNAIVQDLFKELYASNQTLSNLTITTMVNKVRWMLPMEELIETMSNISTNAVQNVNALMALSNENHFSSSQKETFEAKLRQLKLDQVGTVKLENSVENHVKNSIENSADNLLDNSDKTVINKSLIKGYVCLYQKHNNGSNLYMQECVNTNRLCVQYYPKSSRNTVYNFNYDSEYDAYTLNNKNITSYPLLISEENEELDGARFNVRTFASDVISRHWKVDFEDDRVIIKNTESSLYLCAWSSKSISAFIEWIAYTRDRRSFKENPEECKWFVEDCSGLMH